MSAVKKLIFFLALFAFKAQGQITPSLVEPKAYFSRVVEKFWARVKEYGVSNLPVEDVSATFNSSSFGFELIGQVTFEDGFVQDVESVSMSDREFRLNLNASLISMQAQILFTGLQLYRDLRADLTTGLKVGTIVFTSSNLVYSIQLRKTYTNDTIVPTLSFSSQSGVLWDIHPDDMTTRVIKRQYLMQNSAPGSAVVVSTAERWIPLFQEFLTEIVNTMAFPEVIF